MAEDRESTPPQLNNSELNSESQTPDIETLLTHAYDWKVEDQFTDDGHVAIHAWTLDRDSNPYLIRINDFPAFCHIELPMFVNNRPYQWTHASANLILQWLHNHGVHPINSGFKTSQKLYYYRGGRQYPMILVMFRSLAEQKKCKDLLSQVRKIQHIGFVACRVWETHIPLVRKLLTQVDVGFAQWFRVQGRLVSPEERISTLPREYMVNWRTMVQVSEDESKGWASKPRILAYDIECYSTNHRRFPIEWYAKDVIYMISCIYQRLRMPETRHDYTIIMADCNYVEREYETVIRVKTETELCFEFARIIRETDPEIVSGYNIFGFDNKYLDARLKRRMQNWPQMGRIKGRKTEMSSKKWRSSGYGHNRLDILQMDGRISIDMLPIVKRDHKLRAYNLETVASHFLGRGKHDVSAQDMFRIYGNYLTAEQGVQLNPENELAQDMWNTAKDEMEKIRKYCIEDSVLVVDLFEKLSTWIGLVELSSINGVTVMELFTRGQQVRVLSQLYNLAARRNHVIDERNMPKVKFGGGFVYEPIQGLHDNVICLDFKSLYPSIIEAYNICYTTLVPPEMKDQIPDDKCHTITWSEEYDEDAEDPDEDDENDPENDPEAETNAPKAKKYKTYTHKFMKEPKGILPQIVNELVCRRNAVKKLLKKETDGIALEVYDKRQLALKVSANSMYGALGAQEGGAAPLIEGAMSVTAWGRQLIIFCNKYLERVHGARVIYNDTDSTMIDVGLNDPAKCFEVGRALEKELSAQFPDPLYLEFEKAGRILCIKKKNYVYWLVDKDGNYLRNSDGTPDLMYKGIPLARRDNCQWQRDIYHKTLMQIITRQTFKTTLNILFDEVHRLYTGQYSWQDFVIIRSLGASYKNPSYFMKVFGDELRRIGKPASPGDRLEYLIVKPWGWNGVDKMLLGYRMRLPETYLERQESDQPERIDYEYYMNNLIANRLEQLIQVGYRHEIKALEDGYRERDFRSFFSDLLKMGFGDKLQQLWNAHDGDKEKMLGAIMAKGSGMANKARPIRTKYITRMGRNQLTTRIDRRPLKMMSKVMKFRKRMLDSIPEHSTKMHQMWEDRKNTVILTPAPPFSPTTTFRISSPTTLSISASTIPSIPATPNSTLSPTVSNSNLNPNTVAPDHESVMVIPLNLQRQFLPPTLVVSPTPDSISAPTPGPILHVCNSAPPTLQILA